MEATAMWRGVALATALGALAFAGTLPASAAIGGNHMTAGHPPVNVSVHSPAHSRRPTIYHHGSARIRQFNNRLPGTFLPYGAYFDGSSGDDYPDASESPAGPEVILVPSPSSPPPAMPEPPLDLSYVPGCRPIPNGHHCDPPEPPTGHR